MHTKNNHLETSYLYCLDYILQEQINTGWLSELRRFDLIIILDQYQETHGEDSIPDMAGFIQYALNNQLDSKSIKATLAHDLNGRRDKLMCPRTSGYLKFFTQPESI